MEFNSISSLVDIDFISPTANTREAWEILFCTVYLGHARAWQLVASRLDWNHDNHGGRLLEINEDMVKQKFTVI